MGEKSRTWCRLWYYNKFIYETLSNYILNDIVPYSIKINFFFLLLGQIDLVPYFIILNFYFVITSKIFWTLVIWICGFKALQKNINLKKSMVSLAQRHFFFFFLDIMRSYLLFFVCLFLLLFCLAYCTERYSDIYFGILGIFKRCNAKTANNK